MDKKYYSLYHDKEKCEIKINLLRERDLFVKWLKYHEKDDMPLVFYNYHYYLGIDRKALKEQAKKIKRNNFV